MKKEREEGSSAVREDQFTWRGTEDPHGFCGCGDQPHARVRVNGLKYLGLVHPGLSHNPLRTRCERERPRVGRRIQPRETVRNPDMDRLKLRTLSISLSSGNSRVFLILSLFFPPSSRLSRAGETRRLSTSLTSQLITCNST